MIIEGLIAIAIGWYLVVQATWSPRDSMDIDHEQEMSDSGVYTTPLTSRVVNAGQGMPGYVASPSFKNMGRNSDFVLDRIRRAGLAVTNSRRHLYLQSAQDHGVGGGFSNTYGGIQPDVVPNHKTYTSALPGTNLPGVNPGYY